MRHEQLKGKVDSPGVSIITINRNNACGLEKTIQSVLDQTFDDYEYIIIDGASDDGSREVIKNCATRLAFWSSEPDTGIYNAMNKGINKAIGNYCLFLNSGDHLSAQDVLADLFKRKPEADIVYTNQHRFSPDRQRNTIFPSSLTFYWLFTEYLPHNCSLIKRSLFNTIGLYREDYSIVSDWLFYLKALAKEGSTYQHFDMFLSTTADGGISNAPGLNHLVQKERMRVMKEEFPLFYEDYLALYNYRHNSTGKRIKRFIKELLRYGF